MGELEFTRKFSLGDQRDLEIKAILSSVYQALQEKLKLIEQEIQRVWHVNLGPSKELNEYLEKSGTEPLSSGINSRPTRSITI